MSDKRLSRARLSLEGLSVGDALGGFLEGAFRPLVNSRIVRERQIPDIEWHYTDDTNMALSIYAILRQHETIKQDELAQHFAKFYNPSRGYGAGARRLLSRIANGESWRDLSPNIFSGGSYGNGGAMRVAPLGAYFADDMSAVIENARLSCEITHYHPEGIAGAIAVAVAAATAWNLRGKDKPTRAEFIDLVLPHIPESEVKSVSVRARDTRTTDVNYVAAMLGNGSRISAQDTVPFVLYMAGEHLDNYEEAIWQTLSGGGDADTTAAMVGGIVALYTDYAGIPDEWIAHREALPEWALG